ncbi:phage integrase family protein [Burkholderia thailandensis 34]|uniref:tyrosine-type recombinase/integrase n=1 Tax=Burkholderia thailandensis TaxID=57975 RepID=UPI0005DA07B0|nr:site-specific integrase [Burkholderia thailandensis]AJY30162.1 phage integrase family protein [Burkholderia thailandensis 34]AOJ58215.1 integrase [Burkholderia thailandensis]KXF63009.1 integrase [Burkholderia thailandensis]PNE76717.1 site-specific integrase [Burkholderia thailandensis]
MATIVKTPSGTWKAVIRKNGWPTTAKTFRTKRDAEDWARRTEDEMVRGVYLSRAPSEKLTVAAALKRYMDEVSVTKKATTQRSEKFTRSHLEAFFGKYSMAAVSADLVAKYRDERLAAGKSNNTVRIELAMLGHLFRVAIQEWGIGLTFNPVANVRKPSPGGGRDRRLSLDEQRRLFDAVAAHSNPMLSWIVGLAVETGMRSSEITGMRRSQIDIERRVVTLRDTKNGSTRTVPLTRPAAEILRAALENPIRPIDTDLIFFGEPGRDGKRKPYVFQKLWAGIVRDLGLADLHFHDLRHEAVSRFVEGGMSDQEVSAISGHKSMQMLKRYTHLRAEDLVEKLDQMKVSKAP